MKVLQSFISKLNTNSRLFRRNRSAIWKKGQKGEAVGVRYIRKELGMRVLNRNWWGQGGEIDVICMDGECLVFVEIKSGETVGHREYFAKGVKKRKRAALKKAIREYLRRMRKAPKAYRYDILSVKLCQEGESDIMHYRNVSLG